MSKDEKKFDISEKMPLSPLLNWFENEYSKQFDSGVLNFIQNIANIITFPVYFLFLIINYLILIISLIAIGVSIMPPFINLLLFTPLGILVVVDFIMPLVRGD